jgi:aldose 1-epimerase
MTISKQAFGRTRDKAAVDLYTLTNAAGMKVKVMTYGATLIAVEVPDRQGNRDNVTLGLNSFTEYESGHPCLGPTCGRFANRIAKGRFTLDGVEYSLATNNGPNHLHGGKIGFDKVLWKAQPEERTGSVSVAFDYISRNGEEGYPGTLTATVTYVLTADNRLKIDYIAECDRATPVNLTNHAYWNLASSGDVLGHELSINADHFLPVDDGLIPLGDLAPVAGGPMDFRLPMAVGSRIGQVPGGLGGYDHCYVLNKAVRGQLSLAAQLYDPKSGRFMEVHTSEPGVQLYTANGLDLSKPSGVHYGKHNGLCLETQHFPDSPNQPQFPSTILRPGQIYKHLTVHKFSVRE